jgi:hypothetical protein
MFIYMEQRDLLLWKIRVQAGRDKATQIQTKLVALSSLLFRLR